MNAQPDDEVLFLVQLTNECEAFHCLPQSGGLLDQNSLLMYGMSLVRTSQSRREQRELDKAKSKGK